MFLPKYQRPNFERIQNYQQFIVFHTCILVSEFLESRRNIKMAVTLKTLNKDQVKAEIKWMPASFEVCLSHTYLLEVVFLLNLLKTTVSVYLTQLL
jgi:hypothetical protein